MRGDQRRVAETAYQVDDLPPGAGIEIRGRLVHDEHRRLHRKDRRYRNALLLSARKPEGRLSAQIERTDGVEGFRDAAADLFGFETHVRRSEGHVFFDRGHEELIVRILKHQPYGLPHQRQRSARERDPAQDHSALRRHQQSVGVQQQSRFPGSVGPDQGDLLPVRDAERDAAERFVTVGITVMHIVEPEVVVAHVRSCLSASRSFRPDGTGAAGRVPSTMRRETGYRAFSMPDVRTSPPGCVP